MAYSEALAARIRAQTSGMANITEKKMFGSLAFLLNGKLFVAAGPGRMMCRVDKEFFDVHTNRDGVSPVIMKGRVFKGYVHISEDVLANDNELKYWISEAKTAVRQSQDVARPTRKTAARKSRK